ncbi:MAG: hypothetical protein Q9203_006016 [Teloschistes exilis]
MSALTGLGDAEHFMTDSYSGNVIDHRSIDAVTDYKAIVQGRCAVEDIKWIRANLPALLWITPYEVAIGEKCYLVDTVGDQVWALI